MKKRLLSFVLAVLMIASLLPATALAADILDSGTCGAEGDGSNLTWTLDSEGVLTISGSGDMRDYDYSSPWYENGNQIQSVFMANGVTSIGNFAFNECTSLTSMTIPDSVTCIGNCAFRECSSLASVTIPDSVTSIGVYAFCACTSLKSVTIPDSVTSIGNYAFSYCTSLTGIWVDEGNSHYFSDASGVLFNKDKTVLAQCPGAFSGSYAIPDGVTSINDAAFVNCESLTSVTIPDGVTNIGYEVFAGCTSLANMVLPNGVTRIGAEAFDWCTSMKSITIPDGVTSIGYDAFSNCKSLTNVYFTGTEEAWNGITIDGGNDALKNAKIHCNYVSHTHNYKDVVTAPTCTEKGYTTHTCACGDSYVDAYVDALGHAWDNGKVTKEPTETETGVKTFTCTRCGETRTETMPVIPHVHSYKDVVTAPTCTEKGYTTHTCACGDSYVDTYTDALGHAWDNGKVTKEPTETETGVKTFTCTRCGETKTETIPKLTHEHSYKAVVTAPTCTSKGYTTHTCACGDSYVDTYVDALGHAWDNGKVTKEPTETETGVKTFTCTRCGETKTEVIPATGSVNVTEMFTDVSHSWADDGIQYCVTHQLMSGIGNNLFGPKLTTTRAQIVQILYNLEGEPKVSGTTPFTDLTQDWYQDAVLWAYQTGVVAGTSSTTFEPDLPVTREQIAVILMEYMTRVLKLERTWTPADLSAFPDAGSVSDWAKDAMADAVGLGLISGASNGGQTLLEPQGSATREQVATILMEFCKNVKK
ncbi:MAG: leucine-rich repeat protein [Oscillospiraceae bacterium]